MFGQARNQGARPTCMAFAASDIHAALRRGWSPLSCEYAFYQAREAINAGFTVHTLTVGADADRSLMKAIAFAGKGEWVDVPGGSTIQEMEEQMKEAFAKIAAKLPPPKLINAD